MALRWAGTGGDAVLRGGGEGAGVHPSTETSRQDCSVEHSGCLFRVPITAGRRSLLSELMMP